MMSTVLTFCCLLVLITVNNGNSIDSSVRDKRNSNNVVKVTTVIEEPYTMEVSDSSASGNDRYKGFIPDLLKKIFSELNRDYVITPVADEKYGSDMGDGTWSGMIGEVMTRVADVAAGPITISSAREQVVDFTKPFMEFGIIVLAKRPESGESLPFSSAQNLAASGAQFGVVRDGHTQSFFRNSQIEAYQNIWQHMSTHPDNQVNTVSDGVQKVRSSDGNYAFLMESTSGDYWVHQEPCDLIIVGEPLNKMSYGFTVRQGDQLKGQIDDILLDLHGRGELVMLRHKWWNKDGACSSAPSSTIPQLSLTVALVALATALFSLLHRL